MSHQSEDTRSPVPCRRPGGCPGEDMYGTAEHNFLCSQCWKEDQQMKAESSSRVRTMVDEGYYQAPRLRAAGEMKIVPPAAQGGPIQESDESVYVNCRPWSRNYSVEPELQPAFPEIQRCAQPECHRPAGRNAEKFCNECHRNYVEIFRPYRQFVTDD